MGKFVLFPEQGELEVTLDERLDLLIKVSPNAFREDSGGVDGAFLGGEFLWWRKLIRKSKGGTGVGRGHYDSKGIWLVTASEKSSESIVA